jgi:hypothetical protein
MKHLLLLILVGCWSFGADLDSNYKASVADFTYKEVAYQNQIPPQTEIDGSPAWRFEVGEPPVSVTQAYSLAWAWVKRNFGQDFEGRVHTAALEWRRGDPDAQGRSDHGWWTIIITETKESAKQAAEFFAAKKGDTYTGAHLRIYVFFNNRIVGPKKKEG